MKIKTNNIYVFLFFLGVFAAGLVGWVMNIAKLWNSGFDAFTGYMIVRAIGIFVAPLGAIVGYF